MVITTTEDLKEYKYFKKHLKITFCIGLLGTFMELVNWNYFCLFNCTLLTFSPFLTLLISKGIVEFYINVLRKEAFQVGRNGDLMDGIWTKNKGVSNHIGHKTHYAIYSVIIAVIPFIAISSLFLLIEKNLC